VRLGGHVPEDNQRIILLNWLISRSATRSRAHEAPVVPVQQLLDILEARRRKGLAIEYWGVRSESTDEAERLTLGAGHDFTRLCHIVAQETKEFRYVTLLLKYADMAVRAFSVEDIQEFKGRDIEGKETERGVTAAHVSFRLPISDSQLDVGKYRCVVEPASPLTRGHIEHFLCRQIRRQTDAEEWTFSVTEHKGRRSRPITKELRYTPRLELHADVGRQISTTGAGQGDLSHMVFTKREARQSIARAQEITQQDVLANVQIKVSAHQGPRNPEEKRQWSLGIRDFFTAQGYEAKLYYRHANGRVTGGGSTTLLTPPAICYCARRPSSPCPSLLGRRRLRSTKLWQQA
jgi:hypothetical protein